jgi:hypothetical protein
VTSPERAQAHWLDRDAVLVAGGGEPLVLAPLVLAPLAETELELEP